MVRAILVFCVRWMCTLLLVEAGMQRQADACGVQRMKSWMQSGPPIVRLPARATFPGRWMPRCFRHALRLPALSASRACKHATTKPTPMHDVHVSCLQREDPLPLTHHGCERAGS